VKFTLADFPPRFRLDTAVHSYGYSMLAPTRWDKKTQTLHRTFRTTPDKLIPATVTQQNKSLIIESKSKATAADRRAITTQLARMLRLTENLSPWFKLHRGANKTQFGRLFRSATLFEDIVKTITVCNVAWPNSIRMNELLCEHYGDGGFPTPAQLANVTEPALKSTCKVGYRADRILRLARNVDSGRLDLASFESPDLTTDELYEKLHAIFGIGASVAAAQDRGSLAARDQPSRDLGDDGRLSGAAHREVADADHGTSQPTPAAWMPLGPAPPHAHHLSVEGIKQGV